jgi:nanoRNase/pAp phosphatase (c-di-AMP/oligoRNAs hydrolase)
VSEVAKDFKGGGHRKAAGFTLSKEVHIDDIFDEEK